MPESELDAEMEKITDSIKQKSRAVVALGKEFYYKQLNLSVEEAYKLGSEVNYYFFKSFFIIINKICFNFRTIAENVRKSEIR